MNYNQNINKAIGLVSEIAGYLWDRGWAERNGGNISYNITDDIDDQICTLNAISEKYAYASSASGRLC